MDDIIPWEEWVGVIEPCYGGCSVPKAATPSTRLIQGEAHFSEQMVGKEQN